MFVLAEFVFHKPYAMDESQSRLFCDALQQHAHLAHTRLCSYLLPLVESQHGAMVRNSSSHVADVKLSVSSLAPHMLCNDFRFTLLDKFYCQSFCEAAIALHSLSFGILTQVSGNEVMDSDDEDDDETEHALRKHTLLTILYLSHPAPLEEVRRKAEAAVVHAATVAAGESASGQPASSATTMTFEALSASSDAPEAAAVHSIDELDALEELSTLLPKSYGTQPAFDVVLVGEMLYFYHNMRFFFSLDVRHCGDKAAFRAARAWEKREFAEVKQHLLKEREKQSIFYLDTSSDDEGDDGSDNDSFDLPLSRINSHGSLMTPIPPTTPPRSAPHSGRPRRNQQQQQRGGRKLRGGRQFKSSDAAAPSIVDSIPVYTPRPRVLAESKAPPNYPIKAWVIQLVCYDK